MEFADYLNNQYKSIKIKYTINDLEVNFLDTVTFKGTTFQDTGQLSFRVYFKDTDTHALLYKTSYHPQHTYRGIVKSQLLRFHRICSEQEHFGEATGMLFSALRERGYSRSFLRNVLRNFLKKKDEPKIEPKLLWFSEVSVQLNRMTKTNFNKFLKGTKTLQNHRIISAFRRNHNLKDMLCKSKLSPLNPIRTRNKSFYFQHKSIIKSTSTNRNYNIRPKITPQMTNCVYLIYCTKCPKQYVGQTKNSIQTRLNQHIYNINQKKETHKHIVNHFIHHGLAALRVMGLQSDRTWTLKQRLMSERLWIRKLNTKYPNGLNED